MNPNTSDIVIRGRREKRFMFLDDKEFLMLEGDDVTAERCVNLVSQHDVSVDVWDRFATRPTVTDETDYGLDPATVAVQENLQTSLKYRRNARALAEIERTLKEADRERQQSVEARRKRNQEERERIAERERAHREEEAANRKRERELHGLTEWGSIRYPNS